MHVPDAVVYSYHVSRLKVNKRPFPNCGNTYNKIRIEKR